MQHDALIAVTRYLRGGGDAADAALYVLSQLSWTPEAAAAFARADGLALLAGALADPRASYEGRGFAAEAVLRIVGRPTGAAGMGLAPVCGLEAP